MSDGFYDWPVERQALALGKLAQVALRAYPGTYAPPELVKYRDYAFFSVRRDDGARLALRIHRHGYHSDAALASELAWMQSLAESGIRAPAMVPSRDGSALTFAEVAEVPERRQVDLLQWLDGQALGELEARCVLEPDRRRFLYSRIGALAAGLHNHSASWSPPAGFIRHDWFADALVGDTPLWGRFWELNGLTPAQVTLLQRTRKRAMLTLAEYGVSPETSGLIHADLVGHNLLVNGSSVHPIDFDDCGFGWHVFELATVLYFVLDDPDYPALRRAVMEGYRAVRPLSERDEAALPLFLVVRGMSYLGWVHTRGETATARELAPMLIGRCCGLCEEYLAARPATAVLTR